MTLDPAPTPGEAWVRATRAWATGDEHAHRRIVVFRPPSALVEAQLRSRFAALRLHRTVEAHGVTGRRSRDAGFNRSADLLVRGPTDPKDVEKAVAFFRDMQWTVDGDVATPATTRPVVGPDHRTRVERRGGGWVVVLSNPDAAPDDEEHLVEFTRHATIHAETYDAATAQVAAGKLRTVLEVNDFITQRLDAVADRAFNDLKAGPPAGPLLLVTDADTGDPVSGARVWADFIVSLRKRSLSVTTDDRGRAVFPKEPDEGIHGLTVSADGYAKRPADVSVHREEGRPEEVHIKIGRPAVVEVMVVLPDDRRAALSVYEGDDFDPAPPGLAASIEPKRLRIPIEWEDEPPKLPEHNPMLRLDFSSSPHRGKTGVIHRVTHAQTAEGRDLPVFRDAPPPDEQTLGVYEIGKNGFGDTVFVIGTLADARAAESSAAKFQWTRNTRVLGPSPPAAK